MGTMNSLFFDFKLKIMQNVVSDQTAMLNKHRGGGFKNETNKTVLNICLC